MGEQTESYADQAAAFITEAERIGRLGLPALPDDPAAAAGMRAAGYDVLAEVTEVDGAVTMVSVSSDDEDAQHAVSTVDVAAALGVPAGRLPAGAEFLATMRETPETGPVLSAFRPLPALAPAPATEMTVHCLLVFGDQAELLPSGGEADDTVCWPAAAITADTGLQLEDLPGKRFRARVAEQDGRVLFSAFSVLG